MNDQQDRSLHERVARLEAAVDELQRVLNKISEAPTTPRELPTAAPVASSPPDAAPPPSLHLGTPRSKTTAKSFELPANMRSNEYWLNKIGIGLLLFGVAFLFKYSIDQGWLTPPIRVAFGLALGIALIVLGIRLPAQRKHFSQVLIGGGIATFYITGFAAFQVLELVSHPVAFAFMVFVTVLAFILSLRQNGMVLSLIGAIGGLGTPFLLYTGQGNLPGLIGYTCLVLAGAGAIYFYRGWLALLLISFFGGWLVFGIALLDGFSTFSRKTTAESWALQAGFFFAFFIFAALPLIREILVAKNPGRWSSRPPDADKNLQSTTASKLVHLLSFSTPLISFAMSTAVWSLADDEWGWIALAGAAIYLVAALILSRFSESRIFSATHAFVSIVLLTTSLSLLFDGDALRFALATEAAALHVIAIRNSFKGAAISAHLLFASLALWMLPRLFFGDAKGAALINAQSLADLWTIAVGFLVSFQFPPGDARKIYRFLVHVAILGWLLRELSIFQHGQGIVTIAWGVYAVILLITGLRMNSTQLRNVAMATLLVVVGKLFLVDLAELETIWRVLLFLGFGGLFLFLSYYFQALWKTNKEP